MAKTKKSLHVSGTSIFIGVLAVMVGVLSILFVQQQSTAKGGATSQVAKKSCDGVAGSPVINVTQRILNDADSGEAGNYWGFDTIERHIQVWQVADAKYCATVDYEGRFAAVAGQRSPGNTGVLTGTEQGTLSGGYRANISGTLLASPTLPAKGSMGTTDYQCTITGNCPGAFDWTTKYFNTGAAGFTFDMAWWGWTYRNGQHVWVNSVDGNSGDIL